MLGGVAEPAGASLGDRGERGRRVLDVEPGEHALERHAGRRRAGERRQKQDDAQVRVGGRYARARAHAFEDQLTDPALAARPSTGPSASPARIMSAYVVSAKSWAGVMFPGFGAVTSRTHANLDRLGEQIRLPRNVL